MSGGRPLRTLTNGQLLRRRSRVGAIYLLGATICLVGGFVFSLVQNDLAVQYGVTIGTLFAGLILWSRNQSYLQKWGPRWRQDGPLQRALRTLDDRHYLLVAPSTRLPDFLLVGPIGVIVLVPSPVRGSVSWAGGEWRHTDAGSRLARWLLYFLTPRPTLGNPSAEAQAGVERTRRHLSASGLNEDLQRRLQVEPLMVFTDPGVKLSVQGSSVTAVLLKSLRGHLRRPARGLATDEIEEIVEKLTASTP